MQRSLPSGYQESQLQPCHMPSTLLLRAIKSWVPHSSRAVGRAGRSQCHWTPACWFLPQSTRATGCQAMHQDSTSGRLEPASGPPQPRQLPAQQGTARPTLCPEPNGLQSPWVLGSHHPHVATRVERKWVTRVFCR